MRESVNYNRSIQNNFIVNNDIEINNKIYELYRVQNLKDSAISNIDEMDKVSYPDDLKLLGYDDYDIKLVLNSMAAVRKIDDHKYHRARQALRMNVKLDSLIRNEYYLE